MRNIAILVTICKKPIFSLPFFIEKFGNKVPFSEFCKKKVIIYLILKQC